MTAVGTNFWCEKPAGGYPLWTRHLAASQPRRLTLKPERIKKIAGSSCPDVLIVSNELDVSVDWVVRELRNRSVSYFRLNTERLPEFAIVIEPSREVWAMSRGETSYDLSHVRHVWYRRPDPPRLATLHLTTGELTMAREQWGAVVSGLRSLPMARWMNLPERNAAAESKILQLRLATSLGFKVPKTVITNSRDNALRLMDDEVDQVVIKALQAPLLPSKDGSSFVFTERLERSSLSEAAAVEPVPFIVQQEIDPKEDVRVTVVERKAVAAAPVDQTSEVDWRVARPLPAFRPHEAPDEILERCIEMVHELGLRFGALDFARTNDGEYFFLEINPNGEWGWLNKTDGLPIATLITDALTRP